MRKESAKHLGQDESDLFNILNNFDIRHNNEMLGPRRGQVRKNIRVGVNNMRSVPRFP